MKFGKSIGNQQEGNTELHYVEYKLLKKRIKDVVSCLESSELAEALTANTSFEEELSAEIAKVNNCFAQRQQELLERTGALAEELQTKGAVAAFGPGRSASSASGALQAGCAGSSADSASASVTPQRPDAFRRLVEILGEVDHLRKYAVWNAVAVVKILKKRRKQTNFGLEDTASERAGWLSRQSFFSGSDFAELHAAIESLGHMLVLSELTPGGEGIPRPQPQLEKKSQQCPICLDTISDMVELSCNHRFCWKCFVLGPIAHQPGEYRITQCPICRRETSPTTLPELGEVDPETAGVGIPSSEGMLTRFLHTYFPQEQQQSVDDAEREAKEQGEESEREMRDVVGELVKTLVADSSWKGGSKGASASSQPQESDDFFQTLPQISAQDKQLIGTAQKLQWLQLASYGDPLAVDATMYCSLCSEPLLMEAVVTTPCKHHFHRVCINRLDLPQCPLCTSALPFSWFLPSDHPCVEHGFRCVPAHSYKPQFAGGPSRGSCGYPLHRPPPVSLIGPNSLTMKSYLHRVVPTGDARGDSPRSPSSVNQASPSSPRNSPEPMVGAGSAAEGSSASESSSEDSGSEEGGDADRHRAAPRRGRAVRSWAYSAIGRVRLLEPGVEVGSQWRAPAAATAPPAGLVLTASNMEGAAAADDGSDAASSGNGPAGVRSAQQQRNSTVLLIGDHL